MAISAVKAGFFIRLVSTLGLLVLVMAVYLFWARPYQLHWGATEEEIARPMPGDALDPAPTFLSTRAITIEAPPEKIFPWLLQMGYGRAGYYGYDILENLGSPRGMASAEEILPEFQDFKVGDKVPISSVAQEVFSAIEPNSYLIWAGETGSAPGGFTWSLYPINESQTRLVSRIRWSHHPVTQPGLLSLDLFTEFTDHLAVRKILQGIKGRVEGNSEPGWVTNLEFFTFVLAALIFFAGLVLTLTRPLSLARWLAGLASGAGWLVTWYTELPYWGGIVLELVIMFLLYRAFFSRVKIES